MHILYSDISVCLYFFTCLSLLVAYLQILSKYPPKINTKGIKHLYNTSLLFLFSKCAQIVPLTGGQKDMTPPKLLSVYPPNYSKQQSPTTITFQFDEKIQLLNPHNNIIITPRTESSLQWQIKNKSLQINLPKDLKPNTTYKILFNKTIADLSEKNTIDYLEYIFSTGKTIDSLYIKGIIKNAYTQNPEKHILLMLYEADTNDSIVLKEKPLYFTYSHENGEYNLKNLPHKSFQIFAISDHNNNFLYDPIKEKIGFTERPVNPETDSIVNFFIAEEQPLKNALKKYDAVNSNQINLIYTYPDKFYLKNQNKNWYLINDSLYSDTCKLFVQNTDTATLLIQNSTQTDTVQITRPLHKKQEKKYTLKNQYNQKQPYYLPLLVQSNFWIDSATVIKKTLFYKNKDSTHSIDITPYITLFPHQIILSYPFEQNTTYTIKLPVKSTDTKDSMIYQKIIFTTNTPEEYAQLKINILLPDKKNYILALCNMQHKILYQTYIQRPIAASNQQSVEFKNLIPDTYLLKLIQDDNQNYKWDTHQFILHKPKKQFAEKIFMYPKPIKLINNWEVVLDWKEIK